MSMVAYKRKNAVVIAVLLENKIVGHIKAVQYGWAYFPKNSRTSGDVFNTINLCKMSLEEK